MPLRVFVGLLLAVTPPLLVVGAAFLVAGGPGGAPDSRVVAAVALGFTLGWAAILTVVYTRWLSQESQSLVALAEQGAGRESADDAGTAYRRMADSLDERNRQVAELAARVSNAPINDPPRVVAHHVVQTARQVTRDPTWLLAVRVSHVHQTPLTSIRAVAADLQSRPGLGTDASDGLERIANQADRLRRMVGQ